MEQTTTTVVLILGALGGWEFIKYLLNRRAMKRQEVAAADAAEIKADTDEYHLLRERLEFSDKQLYEKEQRFNEQTDVLRDTNRQLIEAERKIGQLQAENSALKAERAMKLCERRGCGDRQPQSGY